MERFQFVIQRDFAAHGGVAVCTYQLPFSFTIFNVDFFCDGNNANVYAKVAPNQLQKTVFSRMLLWQGAFS